MQQDRPFRSVLSFSAAAGTNHFFKFAVRRAESVLFAGAGEKRAALSRSSLKCSDKRGFPANSVFWENRRSRQKSEQGEKRLSLAEVVDRIEKSPEKEIVWNVPEKQIVRYAPEETQNFSGKRSNKQKSKETI